MNFWPFRKKPESRSAADESWAQISTASPLMGGVTPRMAENLSACSAAVDLISTSIASCPAYLYRLDSAGRRTELPPAKWMTAPNRFQCWSDLIAFMLRQTLLYGNSIVWVHENERGEVDELRPIPWTHVSWQLKDGSMTWSFADAEGVWGPAGTRYVLGQGEAMHLKDAQDLAYIGVSRLRRAAAVIRQADKANGAAERLYEDAVRPSGALTTDAKLDGESRTNLRAMLKGFTAAGGRSAMILDGGLKWQTFSINAEDAELLESRRFSVEECARIWNIPPHLLGEMSKASYNVAEASMRAFAQTCLLPWTVRLEQAFQNSVLPRGQRLTIDLEGIQRADMQAQWTAYEKAVNAGILSVDDVRQACGYDPLGGEFAIPRTINSAAAQEGGQSNGQDA